MSKPCPNDPCAEHGVVGLHNVYECAVCGTTELGVSLIVIMHGKNEGDPPAIVTMSKLHEETVVVNFIEGTIKTNTINPPTIIDSDTGLPYEDVSSTNS